MHKPWLYHITGISGYQVVAQRVERHGRSREIRNAHVLARCGTFEAGELAFLLDKPPFVALAALAIILNATAAVSGRKAQDGHERLDAHPRHRSEEIPGRVPEMQGVRQDGSRAAQGPDAPDPLP